MPLDMFSAGVRGRFSGGACVVVGERWKRI